MKFSNKIFLISILIAVFMVTTAHAAEVRVRAKMDSTTLLMGKFTAIKLEIEQDKGAKGKFPLFEKPTENGYVSVCADSVEFRYPTKMDTVEKNGREVISCEIPVQSFDSGYYKLPEIAYVVGRDTSYSNSLALKVVPVLTKDDDQFNGYANVSDPENPSIFDIFPDWMIKYWWILPVFLLLIGIAIWLYVRYKSYGSILPKKPLPTPYELAMASLQNLKSQKLWEQGAEKEFYTQLTDILRIYLHGRFGINAMEMTSRQIMTQLKKLEETKNEREYFKQILSMADFVKFAKVRPLPEDNEASMDNAIKFVETTKPVPVEPDNEAETVSQNIQTKKKGGRK